MSDIRKHIDLVEGLVREVEGLVREATEQPQSPQSVAFMQQLAAKFVTEASEAR